MRDAQAWGCGKGREKGGSVKGPIDLWERVYRFMWTREQSVPSAPFAPQIPSDDVVRLRCRMQLEETLELLDACFHPHVDHAQQFDEARSVLLHIINNAPVVVDLVAYADANADIRCVAYGNDIAAGIDGRETDKEVALSNDTKGQPDPTSGKIVKGEGYRAPDIAGVLEDLGWRR
jgi:predicted HAD superfamily Cof-like phosphohydrolase